MSLLSLFTDVRNRRADVGSVLAIAVPAGLLACAVLPFVVMGSSLEALGVAAASCVALVVGVEGAFRAIHRIVLGRPYRLKKKVPFEKIYFEPHPYLSYVYKKNARTEREDVADYPLHGGVFTHPRVATNNRRHRNGPDGTRDVEVPKPEHLIRVCCLGASTTDNYIGHEGLSYSYPLELERILNERFPDRAIEVNNCGTMGYTSAEILVKFLLDTVDTAPDFVVLYHARNDLEASLTPGFESDYSHARRNLGEAYQQLRLSSRFPDLPLASYNLVMNSVFRQNIRYGIIEAVQNGRPDIDRPFMGFDTYRRNIEHLIAVCAFRGIRLVLSTYCFHLFEPIREHPAYLKYRDGVARENEIVKELARLHGLPLVDCDALVPRDDRYFVDSIHFTPDGMKVLAEHVSAPLVELIAAGAPGCGTAAPALRRAD